MPTPRRIVIVGATSSIAEHCARLWAAEAPSSFMLVARDAGRAERIAADLRVRGAIRADVLVVGFVGAEAIADAVRRASEPGPPDLVLVAHGNLPEQARCQDLKQGFRREPLISLVSASAQILEPHHPV